MTQTLAIPTEDMFGIWPSTAQGIAHGHQRFWRCCVVLDKTRDAAHGCLPCALFGVGFVDGLAESLVHTIEHDVNAKVATVGKRGFSELLA